jgi:hypothetical protein
MNFAFPTAPRDPMREAVAGRFLVLVATARLGRLVISSKRRKLRFRLRPEFQPLLVRLRGR